MELINSLDQLKKNIATLDRYLSERSSLAYEYALSLVQRGTCFIAVKDVNYYRFYPSRFIGYLNNDMNSHISNKDKDGRETNPAITMILNSDPSTNASLNTEYKRYCELLGFTPNEKGAFGRERKFWVL